MPTYDYKCKNNECQHIFEEFQSIKDDPLKVCPKCSNNSLVRLIGKGAGVIFNCDGVYSKDYKARNASDGAK